MKTLCKIFLFFVVGNSFSQGAYAPTVGVSGTTAVHKDSSIIVSWANNCIVTRGLMQINNAILGFSTQGDSSKAIGKADGVTVSLGDSGVAIYALDTPIYNGLGNDFAVFENSFSNTFLELAFVEVSSDGANYFRFPSKSTTQNMIQIGSFGTIDCTNIHNLAGKYKVNYGTPFDLEEITNNLLLDKNRITHIKIIDVIGVIDSNYASFDSEGNKINDPFPTPFASSGFDLDAIGLININAPVSLAELKSNFKIYPNPVRDRVTIQSDNEIDWMEIYTLMGVLKLQTKSKSIDLTNFKSGVYLVKIFSKNTIYVEKLVKK